MSENSISPDRDRENTESNDILSKAVKAGHRTYFFDVKATRNNDYYLTITESRRKIDSGGGVSYDKHKIYLYKEDFRKFANGLNEMVEYVKTQIPEFFEIERETYGTDRPERAAMPVADKEPYSVNDIDREFDNL